MTTPKFVSDRQQLQEILSRILQQAMADLFGSFSLDALHLLESTLEIVSEYPDLDDCQKSKSDAFHTNHHPFVMLLKL